MITSPVEMILVVIASIAATVWLFTFWFLVNSPVVAARRPRDEFERSQNPPINEASTTRIVGTTEIEGEKNEISRKLASVLARDGILPGIPIQILERTDERIAFRSPTDAAQPRGEIRLSSIGMARTRADYSVEYASIGRLLNAGWIVQMVSLVLLAVGFWAIRTYVASSPNPAIKWQSVQLIHIMHVIWPPILLAVLYRRGYRHVRTKFDTTLSNLPHTNI